MPEYLLAIVSVGFVVFFTLFVGSFFILALCTGVVRVIVRFYRDIFIGQPRTRPQQNLPPARRHRESAGSKGNIVRGLVIVDRIGEMLDDGRFDAGLKNHAQRF